MTGGATVASGKSGAILPATIPYTHFIFVLSSSPTPKAEVSNVGQLLEEHLMSRIFFSKKGD
jgi:hypothetical protein